MVASFNMPKGAENVTAEEYVNAIEKAIGIGDIDSLRDALAMCRALERVDMVLVSDQKRVEERVVDDGNFATAHALNKQIRAAANAKIRRGEGQEALNLYYDTHLFDAPYSFDSFCIYIEKDREPRKKFYMPRRKQLLPLVEALQDLEDGKLYLLGISMPPGTGKTTLAEFFMAWTSGKHPELASLVGSHSFPFVDGMYGEMLRIFDPYGEYRWSEVFPGLQVVGKSARMRMIDIGSMRGRGKRFMTIEFGTLGSSLAGRVRATNLLYCDDLVNGIEAAMSRERMDKLWQQYYTDLRQRKIGDRVKELHIATRWSVHDVLGRLEQECDGDPYARFIRVPALNEDGESNFAYPYGLGYSTEQLVQQRDIMDDASWKALFMNEPIEREGQLYDPQELRRYSTLPEAEPDAIIAVCDTKEQGGDYLTMPIAYQYGTDYYIDDFICDNGKAEMLIEKVAQRLKDRNVQLCRIESNRGGTLFAEDVERRLLELGGNTHITTKWTQTNKETRIEVSSAWVKAHCLFKYEKEYEKDKDYRTAMNFLCSYSMSGKNKYDDVPDALSMLTNFATGRSTTKVRIIKRNF